MPFYPDKVAVVTVDSFSTLVDPRSAATALEGVVDDPTVVANDWHSIAVRFATVSTVVDHYSTYFDLHCDSLDYLLRERGLTLPRSKLDSITGIYHDLSPFGDVIPAISELARIGRKPSIVSNGDPTMLDALVENTGIEPHLDQCISANTIGVFKPDERLYRFAANELNTPIESIAHVGAGWGDIKGCMHAGMQGIWLNRFGNPWPPFGPGPDLEVESLLDVVDRLDS